MTDTINVPRELLERWKKSLNKIALQSAFNIADELSAIIAQPAADCGLEVVAYRVSLPGEPELGIWLGEHAEDEPQTCLHEPLIRKSDADARIAELEALLAAQEGK